MKLIRNFFALCAALFVLGGTSLTAQETAARERVVIVPGARPQGARIVQIAPRPLDTPARAYEGVKQFRDWRWYATSGPAIARARFEAYAGRYAPSFVHGYAYGWYGGGYGSPLRASHSRTWRR